VAVLSGLRTPDRIRRVFFRNLADAARQADYIVVCPYAFRENAYRLLKRRHLEGFSVVAAPIEDIYNEFSYGVPDAGAVKQFLGYAFHHWQAPVPRYVLLAGDGTYDPKGNLGPPADNLLPVHYGPSTWRWTSLDNWFVLVNGPDQLADMAVGRVPVSTDDALEEVADKVIAFEDAIAAGPPWSRKAAMVADDKDGALDFKLASQTYVEPHLTAAGFTEKTPIFLDDYVSPAEATADIRAAFHEGRFLVTFFGHGAEYVWTGEMIWQNSDVSVLTNSRLPVVAMFTCQTAYYHDPDVTCLGEALLRRPSYGAAGCFGPSILGRQDYSEYVADGFASELARNGCERLGEAMMAAVSNLFFYGNEYVEELRAYVILGDPALRVNPAE
jgi:hypothetical protein